MHAWPSILAILERGFLSAVHRSPELVADVAPVADLAPPPPPLQDPSLRYAFRVVSPEKEYMLQAENEVEQQEWMQMLQVGREESISWQPAGWLHTVVGGLREAVGNVHEGPDAPIVGWVAACERELAGPT